MENEFKREVRYLVIKRSKIEPLGPEPGNQPIDVLRAIRKMAGEQAVVDDGLVIESDWPEYETAWRMIERRVTGQSALGGEPEVLGYSVKGNRYAIRLTKGELLELHEGYSGDALIELVDRTHLIRLQAEVERLTTENGKIRAINNLLDGINERAHDQIRRMIGRLQSAKPNPDCAICASLGDICVTCEEQAIQPQQMCSACQGYGVIGFTRGQTPESFEQGEYPCPDCQPASDAKPCSAKYGPHECSAARAEDSLFCAQHRSVDGRQRMGSEPITNEGLTFMMQRDGEQQ